MDTMRIMFIVFALAGGVYYFLYALRHGGGLSIEAIAFYALLGAAGILIGVAFAGLVFTGSI